MREMTNGGNRRMPRGIGALLGLVLGLLLAGLATPAAAAGEASWWNKDFKWRKAVTIDSSTSGLNLAEGAKRMPVLVRLTDGNFTFTEAQENGTDIVFVDEKGTALKFHQESYDAKNGLGYFWVDLPNVEAGKKQQIWLYFGNATGGATPKPAETFDPDTLFDFHFADKAGESSADVTSYGNNATNAPAGVGEGAMAQGARFGGQGGLTIADAPSLAMTAGGQFTFTAWVKPDNLNGDQQIFSRGGMVIGIANGVPYVAVAGGRVQASGAIKTEWTHLGVVADGKTLKVFINGMPAGVVSVALPAITGPITLGGTLAGAMDEARLAKIARPDAALLAMANAEGPQNKLVNVANTAEKQSGGSGVLGFIVSKLEPVDAVIIGLCMMLLAAAIGLMYAKTTYLNAANKANRAFFRRFNEMHEQLVTLDKAPGGSTQEAAMLAKKSPIARLYAVGIEELDVRRKALGTRPLSGEAVEAMRAAVDAQFVEENQKLDKLMVILTIAISGGPFIGLLGTVIGVMTVFGGVAMAGDVNVNAIAPGIAAALLATIAGLACAIPSLFGYNYLNGQISALADQMRVFIDRLITRLAEMQADAAEARQAAE